jgi:alpha-tubulin suppressor-like RCC1 family protein
MSRHLGRWGSLMATVALSALAGCAGSAPGKPDGGGGKGGGGGAAGTDGGVGDETAGASGSAGGAAGTSDNNPDAAAGTSGGSGGAVAGSGGAAAGADGGAAGAGGKAGAGADGGTDTTDAGMTAETQPACGGVGQACCSTGDMCSNNNICLNGGVCSCAKSLFGSYFVRTDGTAIDVNQTVQTPVLNAATGQPLTGIVSVTDGVYHGCAALSDGTAWCWRTNAGSGNSVGQLGNGSTDTDGAIYRATQVLKAANSPLTGVKSMSDSANNSTCAIMTDGKLYCWGALTWIVNDGAPLNSGFAQAITLDGNTPLGSVVQASTGAYQGCAIVQGASSKELWCWGYNGDYELGLGDTNARQYPTKVVGPVNPTKVIAGQYTYNGATGSCVLDGDTVRCWGYNGYGQGGANSTANALTSPTLVVVSAGAATLNGIVDLFLGGKTYCALRSSNTLWCWGSGYNDYAGNLGVTNIVTAGQSDPALYLTSDGVYQFGATKVTPNCGALQ